MAAYYNEIEPYAAEWLRNLMKEGLIPDGEVDTRSIVDVRSSDLRGFKQCHFFAGIAGWSHALRLAGWADDREIFTGSCPCQPFSQAGKGRGTADERHLWPVFFNLIAECRPSVVMGEQVASKAGRDWFSGVRSDLETVGYAVGGADLCAAGVGAPHIRQRLWWVGVSGGLAQSERSGEGWRGIHGCREDIQAFGSRPSGEPVGTSARDSSDMADAKCRGRQGGAVSATDATTIIPASDSRGNWDDAVWLTGADGKARRSKPGLPLLVDGFPGRASQLRAYGNAIVPPLAAVLIESLMDVLEN